MTPTGHGFDSVPLYRHWSLYHYTDTGLTLVIQGPDGSHYDPAIQYFNSAPLQESLGETVVSLLQGM